MLSHATEFDPPKEFDDYLIVQELGRGQMGQVYLAEDAVLARHVAIKFIAGIAPDIAARQRFLLEARTAARIQHPNVASVYRVGELGDRPYIVSELIRGRSLAECSRPMPAAEALVIAIDLARGLAAAHRRGVVHCDIKPGNAMLTDEGIPKLVDFGLARVVQDGTDEAAGPIAGTPDYMAPEVWAGKTPSRRSDVYSFGGVLFELITGAPPFADVPARELGRAVRERPAPDLRAVVPEADPRLARLIARCLERDPTLRFASGEELREALEQLHPSRALAVRSDENPYRGLRTFEAHHRAVFFGRGLEVGAIVERLRTESVVIVTGDSGVGKSSLLRAGVVPSIIDGALAGGRVWETVTMVPGRRPLTALATALGDPALADRVIADPEALPRELRKRLAARSQPGAELATGSIERRTSTSIERQPVAHQGVIDHGLVVFVDQMEELVTVGDPAEVEALEAGLARISEGMADIKLVATVRADFLSRIAALPRLGRELSRLLYFVSPMPPERIRDVIVGPATATAVTFASEDMIAELVEATARAGSGGLPLLSFALAELWEARDREHGVIPETALAAMGGVAGALARHADSVIAGMAAVDRVHARRALLRLVTSEGTRVRRTEPELSVGAGTRGALDALVKGRLLVVHDGEDGATYELAHEVLVHGWTTLRDWLDADAADRERRERLAVAAADWARAGQRADLTWRGQHLAEARALDDANLTTTERDFVVASTRAAHRRVWMRRGAVAGVIVLVATVFLVQRHVARDRLDAEVDAEVEAGRARLALARDHDRDQRALAIRAYASFDAGDAAGEERWSRVVETRRRAEIAYRDAAGRIEAAYAKDPARADVRALLGDILLERAQLADDRHRFEQRDELLARLEAYDEDGTRRAAWNRPATLDLGVPAGATVTIEDAARTPRPLAGATELEPGSYTIVARAPGRAELRLPISLARGERRELAIAMPPASAIPEGYVYVAAGDFIYGSYADDTTRTDWLQTVPAHRRTTGAYAIARHETTIAEWLDYASAHPDRLDLIPNITTSASGKLVIDRANDTWRIAMRAMETEYTARWNEPIVYAGRARHRAQRWERLPITGVNARDAEGYAAWLADTGRVPHARLCSELEWERAARGADGRSYPTGEDIEADDINVDVTYGRANMGPDEVGSHPTSTSPHGLADTSGNAFEWTRGERGEYVARGGSFYHDRKTANLTNRYTLGGGEFRDTTLGIRLCADVTVDTSPRPER